MGWIFPKTYTKPNAEANSYLIKSPLDPKNFPIYPPQNLYDKEVVYWNLPKEQ